MNGCSVICLIHKNKAKALDQHVQTTAVDWLTIHSLVIKKTKEGSKGDEFPYGKLLKDLKKIP